MNKLLELGELQVESIRQISNSIHTVMRVPSSAYLVLELRAELEPVTLERVALLRLWEPKECKNG